MKVPKNIGLFYTPVVLLPRVTIKIEITHNINIQTLQYYMKKELEKDALNFVGIIPSLTGEKPKEKDAIGTLAILTEITSKCLPSPIYKITVMGICRFKTTPSDHILSPIKLIKEENVIENDETMKYWHTIVKNIPRVLGEKRIHDAFYNLGHKGLSITVSRSQFLDVCADLVATKYEDRLDILKTINPLERLKKIVTLVHKYIEESKLMDDDSRAEHLTSIMQPPSQIVMGPLPVKGGSSASKSMKELEERIEAANLPEPACKVAKEEFAKLSRMSPHNPEHVVVHSYLDLILSLPWSASSIKEVNIKEAKQTLDKDHYAMDKVKKRVLEYLAVRQLKKDNLRAPILCFVGPPGVGKTSIGRSIANILGREFQRICLGGVSNPSEIRGHRKAYIGSSCGRIIQALKLAGTKNPVILLDEIDKMGFGSNGDPTSALLDVLDPEQNTHFVDQYLGIPFDLSQIIFVATANSIGGLQSPLIDRMEIIPVSGYTTEEKCEIVKNYLLPKQIDLHGLLPEYMSMPIEGIAYIIRRYTIEAGVRGVERNVAALCRNLALTIATEQDEVDLPILLDEEKIRSILGREQFSDDSLKGCLAGVVPGVVIGLAYCKYGGSITLIEISKFPGGNGQFVMTGQLGKILSESATIALNWVRAIAPMYGIVEPGEDVSSDVDVHLHMPEGAIEKEGPSAGIAIATALLSLFSNIPVIPGLALTGEISLQGQVLPVGGLKEKILSAVRAGIKTIIIPKKSQYLLEDIPMEQLKNTRLELVSQMNEVVDVAFGGKIDTSKYLSPKL